MDALEQPLPNLTLPTVPGTKPNGNAPPLLSDDKLRDLYATMLKCWLVANECASLARSKKLAGFTLEIPAAEALAAACALDLRPGDAAAPTQLAVLIKLARGTALREAIAPLLPFRPVRGRKPPKLHALPKTGMASQFGMAAGLALSLQAQKAQNAVVAFADRTPKPPEIELPLTMAALQRLPVVFVIPASKKTDLSPVAHACGLPGIPVAGDDVVALYRVVQESIYRARNGDGATLIQCLTPPREKGAPAGPLERMQRYLAGKGLWSGERKHEIEDTFLRELRQALKDQLAEAPAPVPHNDLTWLLQSGTPEPWARSHKS